MSDTPIFDQLRDETVERLTKPWSSVRYDPVNPDDAGFLGWLLAAYVRDVYRAAAESINDYIIDIKPVVDIDLSRIALYHNRAGDIRPMPDPYSGNPYLPKKNSFKSKDDLLVEAQAWRARYQTDSPYIGFQ